MTQCPFTPQLALYSGAAGSLEEHLQRCPDCRAAAAVRGPGLGSAERTEACPEPVILAAYDLDELETDEQEEISLHIADCAFCQGLLVQARRAETPNDGSLALKEADAYVLATQLAWWLSNDQYPSEGRIVAETIETAYDQAFHSSGPEPRGEEQLAAVGLHFASVGKGSLAHRIVAVCLAIAEIRLSGDARGDAITSRFRSASLQLFPNGESGDLVEQVARWVAAHSSG